MLKALFGNDRVMRYAVLSDTLETWSVLVPIALLITGAFLLLAGAATTHCEMMQASIVPFALAGVAWLILRSMRNKFHRQFWTLHTANWPRELSGL